MSRLDWPQTDERQALASAVLDMSSSEQLSSALDAAGIPWIGIPESAGGPGGQDADLAVAIRVLASQAVSAHAAETGFVGAWALALCGVTHPDAHLAPAFDVGVSMTAHEEAGAWFISGQARQVAGAEGARWVLVPVLQADRMQLALVPIDQAAIAEGSNLAGEGRCDITLEQARADALLDLPPGIGWIDLHARLALARAIQISGALIGMRELTVSYARTREQFGKPIAEQQAVAHMLASIAEQALLAEAAVATAINAPTVWNCAIAKSMTSRAARSASASAHQVHGAMGMSQEYPLGRFTTRLWSWAEEGGRPEAWELWIGTRFLEQDQPQLWTAIVDAMEGTNT